MLNSLSLTNFQRHEKFSHSFHPGLTLCVGPNWVGKSSLMRGILYALFGTSAVPVKAANLTTRGQKGMEAVVSFTAAGQNYEVRRGRNTAELRRAGEVVASGQNPVTAMVESLIGDAKSFLTFQTARQGEAAGLLTLGAAKLAQHIDTVTGASTVDTVLERCRQERSALGNAAEKAAEAETALEMAETECRELTAHLDALKAELAQAEAEARSLSETASEAQKGWETRRRRLEQAKLFEQQGREMAGQIVACEDRLRAAQDALRDNPVANVPTLYERLTYLLGAFRAYTEHEAAKSAWAARFAEADGKLAELRKKLPAEELPDLDELVKRATQAAAAAEVARLTALKEMCALPEEVCYACGRPFEVHDLDMRRANLAEAEQAYAERAREAEQTQQAYEAAKTLHTRRKMVQDRMREHQQVRDATPRWEPRQEVTAAEISAAQHAYETAIERNAIYGRAASEAEQAERELMTLRAVLSSRQPPIPTTEQEVDSALHHYQTTYQAYSEHDKVLAELRTQGRLQAETLRRAKDTLKEAKHAHALLTGKATRDRLLAKLAKYLRDSRDRFTHQTWVGLLNYASTFVSDASGGAITALRRDPQGEFTYVEDGDERPLELASGQQLAILGVAIKLALAAAVGSRFEVLLLDEVAAAASDENALLLTTCLAKTGQQVLLVSHREADAAVANDVIAL
jgi:exonuclease SbcC